MLPEKANLFLSIAATASVCYKGGMTEIQRAVAKLVKQHGGLRKAAEASGIKAPYLSRLHRGKQSNPRNAILRKLGLERLDARYRAISGK